MLRDHSVSAKAAKKVASGALAVLYFLGNVALSHAAETNLWDQRRQDLKRVREADASQYASLPAVLAAPLPSSLQSLLRTTVFKAGINLDPRLSALSLKDGSLKEVWMAPGSRRPPVVLIQDVHLNAEAQKRVAGIIQSVDQASRQRGAPALVGVEGATGPFDFKPFRAFPDQVLTASVADYFLSKNVIAAPSFVGLSSDNAPHFVGIDDPRYYKENVEAYRRSLATRESVRAGVLRLREKIESEKKTLNPSLRSFDQLAGSYSRGGMGLATYLRGMVAMIPSDEQELVVGQFLAACDLEAKLDFPRIEREKSEALRIFSEKASEAELRDLATIAVAYRSGNLSYSEFFSALRNTLVRNNVPLDRMPAFDGYLRYIVLADGVNAARLFAAVRSMERAILSKFCQTPAERQLMDHSRELVLSDKLVDFAMTPAEWQEYKQRFQTLKDTGASEGDRKDFAAMHARLAPFELFYGAADFRSARLVDNVLAAAERDNAPVAAMVIGGFHTPAIEQYLRGRGVSYAVVQLRLSKADAGSASEYLSIFSRDKTPLEKLLIGERLYLAPTSVAVGVDSPLARVATRKILSVLAVGNKLIPSVTGVFKKMLDSGVAQVRFADGVSINLIRGAVIPSRYDDIESVSIPGLGEIHYLSERPSIREWWFALVPVSFAIFGGGLHEIGMVALAASAIFFASLHKNGARFDLLEFSVRALGAFGILGLTWSAVALLGPVTSSLHFLVDLGLAVLIAGILHENWNRLMPKRFELSLSADRAERIELMREARRKMAVSNPFKLFVRNALTEEEKTAVLFYLHEAFNVVLAIPDQFEMTPRVVLAIQQHELAEFMAATVSSSLKQAELDEHLADATRKLAALNKVFILSEQAHVNERAEMWISDTESDSFVRVKRIFRLTVDGRSVPVSLPILLMRDGRARILFDEAARKGNLMGMAEAMKDLTDGEGRDLRSAEFNRQLQDRIENATAPQVREITEVIAVLPVKDIAIRVQAESVLSLLQAALRVLEASTRSTISWADLAAMRRLRRPGRPDHPLLVLAEAHYLNFTAPATAFGPVEEPAEALIVQNRPLVQPEPAVVDEQPEEAPAAAVPLQRVRIPLSPRYQSRLPDLDREIMAATHSPAFADLYGHSADLYITAEEDVALRLYLMAVHGVQPIEWPEYHFTARLVAAIRVYEGLRMVAMSGDGSDPDSIAAAKEDVEARFEILMDLYRGMSRRNQAGLDGFLMSDEFVLDSVRVRLFPDVVEDVRMAVTADEMARKNFRNAVRRGDLAGTVRAFGEAPAALRETLVSELEAALDALLPGMDELSPLSYIFELVPVSLQALVSDRLIEVAIAAIGSSETVDEAFDHLSHVPENHARRASAQALTDAVMAAFELVTFHRLDSVRSDLIATVRALPDTSPARQMAEAHLGMLTHQAAQERLADGIRLNSVGMIVQAIPSLPEEEREVAQEQLLDVAAHVVREANGAAAITDQVIDSLPEADRDAARLRRDALTRAALLPGTGTPVDRLRAAAREIDTLSRAIQGTVLGARVAAFARLISAINRMTAAGLADFLGIPDTYVERAEEEIRLVVPQLEQASLDAETMAEFDEVVRQIWIALDALRDEGLEHLSEGASAEGRTSIQAAVKRARLVRIIAALVRARDDMEAEATRRGLNVSGLVAVLNTVRVTADTMANLGQLRLVSVRVARGAEKTRRMGARAGNVPAQLDGILEMLNYLDDTLSGLNEPVERIGVRAPEPAEEEMPAPAVTPPVTPAVTPAAAPRAPPTPAVPPSPNGWAHRSFQISVFIAVVALVALVIIYAPDFSHRLLRATDLTYAGKFPSAMSASTFSGVTFTGLFLVGARVTYMTVRVMAIVVEGGYRISTAIGRRMMGMNGTASFSDREGRERTDGVVVDFLASQEILRAALTSRFEATPAQLAGLNRGQLMALWFRLDAQDARLEKTQQRLADERKAAEASSGSWWKWLLFLPINIPLHLFTFLRDFFFLTDLQRVKYARQGRFVNHFDSEAQGRALVDAAVEAVRAMPRGMSAGRATVAWYLRNNVALAGLLGYTYRRIRITIFGAIGGWIVSGIGYILPGVANATLDGIFRRGIPLAKSSDGFLYRYGAIALHHLSFSTRSLLTTFFTAFGLNIDSQLRRIHATVMRTVSSPLGAGNRSDFDALEQTLRNLATAPVATDQQSEPILEILARTEALIRTQRSLGRFSLRRFSLGRFSDDEVTVIRRNIAAAKERHFAVSTLDPDVRREFDALVEHNVGRFQTQFSLAPGFFSGTTRRALWKDIRSGRFIAAQFRSMWGMWTLGAEIAVVVELAGDIGHRAGQGVGYVTGADQVHRDVLALKGELTGRNAANILEGEHGSAMSLMSDLQHMVLGRFGVLPPPAALPDNLPGARPDVNYPDGLRFDDPNDLVGPVRIPTDARDYRWIESDLFASASKWAVLQRTMRQKGMEWSAANGRPVELPTLPVDRNGIPIQVVAREGGLLGNADVVPARMAFLLADGTRIPMSETPWDPATRSFTPPPGKTFAYLRLNVDDREDYRDNTGQPLRDTSGRVFVVGGFRVHDPAAMNGNTVAWRDGTGTITQRFVRDRVAVPVNPETGDEIILEASVPANEAAVALAQRNRDLVKNRLEVTRQRLTDVKNIALEIDKDFKILKVYATYADMPKLKFYRYLPGGGPAQEFDPRVEGDIVPDIIRNEAGNEVVFTVKADREVVEARRDANKAKTDTIGAWSMSAWPVGTTEPQAVHNALLNGDRPSGAYMLVKFPNGNLRLFSDVRSASSALQAAGIPGPQIAAFTNDRQFSGLSNGELTWNNVEFHNNDSEKFYDLLLEWYHQQNPADIRAPLIRADLHGAGLLTEAQLKAHRDQVAEISRANKGVLTGGPFNHKGAVVFLVPVSAERQVGMRRETVNFTIVLTQAQKNQWEADMILRLPGGLNLVRPVLGYRRDVDGKITRQYTTPASLRRDLQRDDLIYEISDGRKLPFHKLPANMREQNLVVTSIIDPRTNETIVTGSSWARLNFMASTRIRIEQTTKGVPPVIIGRGTVTVDRNGVPTIRTGMMGGAPYATYMEQEWTLFLSDLSKRIDAAPNQMVKNQLLEVYQKALQRRMYITNYRNAGVNGAAPSDFVILKGTVAQTIAQSERELRDVIGAQNSEEVRRHGGGMRVIQGGEEYEEIRALSAERERLVLRLETAKAKLADIREKAKKRLALTAEEQAILKDWPALILQRERELAALTKEISDLGKKRLAAIAKAKIAEQDIILFDGNVALYRKGLEAQRDYVKGLQADLKKVEGLLADAKTARATEADPKVQAQLDEAIAVFERRVRILDIRIKNSLGEDSFVLDGVRYTLIAPWTEAELQAVLMARQAASAKDTLVILEQVLSGKPVVVRRDTTADGAVTFVPAKPEDRLRAKKAYLERERRNAEALRAVPAARDRMLARLARVEADFESFQDINADGSRTEWTILTSGASIHVTTDAKGKTELHFEPLERGTAFLQARVEQLQEIIRGGAGPVARGRAQRELEEIQSNNTLTYVDGGVRHQWINVFSLPDATKDLELKEARLNAARILAASKGTHIWDVGPDSVTRIIGDEAEVRNLRRELEGLKAVLKLEVDQKKKLIADGRKAGRDMKAEELELAVLTKRLQDAERGVFEKDGHRYVINYSLEETKERHAKVLRKAINSVSAGSRSYTLLDANDVPIGQVVTNGRHFIFTEGRVISENTGLAEVEIRTYTSDVAPTFANKGKLLTVSRIFVDGTDRIAAQVSGSVNNEGEFQPRSISFNQFIDGVDRPVGGQSYRYVADMALADYPKHPELLLDYSRAISTPADIARTGQVEIELQSASGSVWREIRDLSGRVLVKIEGRAGVDNEGRVTFRPMRRLVNYYENPDFAMHNIASRTETIDIHSGEKLGVSYPLTGYARFTKDREVLYERWVEATKELVWEVRGADGLLLRKYALEPVPNGKGGVVYVPYNVTMFVYTYGPGSSGVLALADRAYTFETDNKGLIEGRFDPAGPNANPADWPYFEHTEILKVSGQGPLRRISYRVSVRNGEQRDFEQFQEVKNGDGELLERHVGHRSGVQGFEPEEITFNGYDDGPRGFGRYGVTHRSKSFSVAFNGRYDDPSFDLTNLKILTGSRSISYDGNGRIIQTLALVEGPGGRHWVDVRNNQPVSHAVFANIPLQDNVFRISFLAPDQNQIFTMTLKERSDIEGIDAAGHLDYRRYVYRYNMVNGVLVRVVHSSFRDRIYQGHWRQSLNFDRMGLSRVDFDRKKLVTRGQLTDSASHPSLDTTIPGEVLSEEAIRQRQGVMVNPYLPDMPARFWMVFDVVKKNRAGDVVFRGTRWVDVYGRTGVEVANKTSTEGAIRSFVAVHVSDNDELTYNVRRLAPGKSTVRTNFAGGTNALINAEESDFVYIQIESVGTTGQGAPETTLVFRDAAGREVRAGDGGTIPFWLPVSDNTLRVAGKDGAPVAGIQVIGDSPFLQKRFLLAVPVAALREQGLDVRTLRTDMAVEVNNSSQRPENFRISAIYRTGRTGEEKVAEEKQFVESNGRGATYEIRGASGQLAYHDATSDSKEGSGVTIKSADERTLGVVREYRYKSERGGIPVQQRRVILYDHSGQYPIASVRLVEVNGQWTMDRSDVIPFSVREEGNEVIVYSIDPTNNYHYEIPYRMNALEPGKPEVTRVGDLSVLPGQQEGLGATAQNRLHNSPYQILVRWARGDRMGTRVPTFKVTPADIDKAADALDNELLQTVMKRLDESHDSLPVAERPVSAAEVNRWSLTNLGSVFGVIWLGLLLSPFWLYLWSARGARKWQAWRVKLDQQKRDRRRAGVRPLWDQKMMLRALQRFNEKVFETKVRELDSKGQPVLLTANGDIEGAFVNNLFLIYLLAFAANERAGRAIESPEMAGMDEFARAVARFMTTEIGRGSDAKAVKRPAVGKVDIQVWSKLEIFLASYRDRLKTALITDVADTENPGTVRRFDLMADSMLMQTLTRANGGPAEFDNETMQEYMKRERLSPVAPLYITVGRYIPKILPVVIGTMIFRGLEFTITGSPWMVALFVLAVILTIVINAMTEARAIAKGKVLPSIGLARGLPPVVAVFAAIMILSTASSISLWALFGITLIAALMFVEALGILLPSRKIFGGNRSLIGVSWWYHVRPPFSVGRPRAILISSLVFVGFVIAGSMIGTAVLPWFLDKVAAGSVTKTVLAFFLFVSGLPSLHHGVNLAIRTFFTAFFPTLGAGPGPKTVKRPGAQEKKFGVMHVGGNPMTSPAVTSGKPADAAAAFAATFEALLRESAQGRAAMELLFLRAIEQVKQDTGEAMDPSMWDTDAKKVELVKSWMLALNKAELESDPGDKGGTTLWSLRQMKDANMPEPLKVGQTLSANEQEKIEHAFHIRRSMVELLAGGKVDGETGRVGMGGNSLDTATNFVDWAEGLADAGLADEMVFYLVHNQYEKHDDPNQLPDTVATHNRSEIGQRVKLAGLLQYVSERPGQKGVKAYVMYNHTVFGMKSSAMNADRMRPEELPLLEGIIITDRNTSTLDVPAFVRDVQRMKSNKNIVIMVNQRNTTYTVDAMGKTSFAIEGGHGESMKAISDKIGTGWGNMMRVLFWDVMSEYAEPGAPFVSFSGEMSNDEMMRMFGIVGFAPNAVGISEDYWAVLQQYHNMVGLGMTPELAMTDSQGHKVRESKDYAEWQNAPPRWSSGLDATMMDMLNQQVNEFGPDSVFEKEIRQTNADHYLLGPLVLFQLVMIPLSVGYDLSPFVGLSIVFWLPGIFLNQVSTLNSLIVNIRHMGFRLGLSRWLRDRIPDSLLFAPRTVRDALAQITGYKGPSFEFKISGAGGTDDPWKAILGLPGYNPDKPVRSILRNLRTIVKIVFRDLIRLKDPHTFLNTFVFGLFLLSINVFAMQYLDATNAVMMILSLWFAVGVTFGPMMKARKIGVSVWGGAGDILAKISGFGLGFLAMLAVSGIATGLTAGTGLSPVYSALLIISVVLYRVATRSQKMALREKNGVIERLMSETRRGFWSQILLFGWFVFIPVHPMIRFDLVPGIPLIFTPIGFGVFALIVTIVLTVIIVEGMRAGENARARVNKRFIELTRAHTALRGIDHSLDNQVNALTTRVVTLVQQEAYKYADQSLNQMAILIDGIRVRRHLNETMGRMGNLRRAPREQRALAEEAQGYHGAGQYGKARYALTRLDEMLVPGAMGFWRKIGVRDLTWMGRLEGLLSAGVALGIIALMLSGDSTGFMGLVRDALISASNAILPSGIAPIYGAILAAGTVTAGLLGAMHAIFGVENGGSRPDRRVFKVLGATMTASLPLIAIPILAFGFSLGGPLGILAVLSGGAIMAGAHGALNRRLEKSDRLPDLARTFAQATGGSSTAQRADGLSRLIEIENLGLEKFGRAAGRERSAQLAEAFGFESSLGLDVESRRDRFYWMNSVTAERPAAVQTVREALEATRGSQAEGAALDLFVPEPAADATALLADINKYRQLTGNENASILLVGANEAFAGAVRGNVLRASEVTDPAVLSKWLEKSGASLKHLRVLVHRNVVLPDNILSALIALGQRAESPVAVDILILAALDLGALAIRAGVNDLEGLMSFRRLVATQA